VVSLALAQPTSEEDIQALRQGSFYSFPSTKSKIKQLSLYGCGSSFENKWEEHPERLEGLLAAISKTSIKDSLETLNVEDCNLNEKQVNEMKESHGFSDILKIMA
jgi:hypothetical protein